MWLRDFHIDALRLDAVHAIKDFSPNHILREIKQHVDKLNKTIGQKHYLIVESDLNDNRFINPINDCGYGMDAQWIDEFHHALRVGAGEKRTGYYSDFHGITHLAKSYKDAYVYDGQFSLHRKRTFGVKTDNSGTQFIVFSQNHDQVGNRMFGERTSVLVSFEMQKLLAGAVMVSPYLPMLFMGEEWSEPHPFQYFVSHTDPQLAEAVCKGRKEEFAAFHLDGEAPDPMSDQTFQQSKLQWDLLKKEPHQTMLRYYQQLITLRKQQPALNNPDRKQLLVECNPDWQTINLHRWSDSQQLICLMNFSKKQQHIMLPSIVQNWHKMLDSAAPEWKGPHAAPEVISGESPGSSGVLLQPESLLIYSNNIYSS
jgi:maltooligosyltrehalose trehalohydrolase